MHLSLKKITTPRAVILTNKRFPEHELTCSAPGAVFFFGKAPVALPQLSCGLSREARSLPFVQSGKASGTCGPGPVFRAKFPLFLFSSLGDFSNERLLSGKHFHGAFSLAPFGQQKGLVAAM